MDIEKIKAALKPLKDRLDDRTKFEEATYGKSYKASDDFEIYVPIGYLRRAAEAYAALEAAQGLIDKPLIEGGGVNRNAVLEEAAQFFEQRYNDSAMFSGIMAQTPQRRSYAFSAGPPHEEENVS